MSALDFEEAFADELAAVPEEFVDEERFVPAAGPLDAEIVFVGEAPGATEVAEGRPFVGRAGGRLDSLLETTGIDRETIYVTNLVKARPPENRDPTADERRAWKPLLDAELDRVDPAVVVTLGAVASGAVLDTDEPVGDLRDETYEVDGQPVLPTYHPAATFYDDGVGPMLERDLRVAREIAEEA
ncbi:phage SPO1 DNA polymerase-like protein [Halosimplex carlsbadense 2-9-1]|uniref:Type-4 uracil-DNA glycosylase n=1 Tax=Halosimplex carlsbadense 2-9-1 TaxID=797114 RepID=M0CBA6_9EURY|nr:uracil-DNA glycosylase [Halosimplex carlsbadense]ELZ19923.1 phage SPO1 DNA polymerase-like protein [Halosimplex carlsbadense 2-9-1]